ncbi:hypothetical protein [Deinococcus hopiensis]|uniref:hypothetical protein n=1 Tax=Deinococcus hopiensis TaxID=309885 RepID=UPI00111BE01D|nr:hypothetical protein [Deinococcus hopiensis]
MESGALLGLLPVEFGNLCPGLVLRSRRGPRQLDSCCALPIGNNALHVIRAALTVQMTLLSPHPPINIPEFQAEARQPSSKRLSTSRAPPLACRRKSQMNEGVVAQSTDFYSSRVGREG